MGSAALADPANAPTFTEVAHEAGVDYLQQEPPNGPPGMREDFLSMTGGASAGDFDNDGWVDLFVTRMGAPSILFRNRGDGTFEDVTARSFREGILTANGAGWADIDNDGDLDLYVTAVFDKRFYLYVNDGRGRFSEQAIARGAAVAGNDDPFGFSVTFGD
jgi:hypothetical protein